MILRSTQLPTLFPSYDERASQPISSIDVPSVDVVKFDGGEDQYFPGSWTVDNRPTKEEVMEKIDDFRFVNDILDIIVPESIKTNIPRWIRVPYVHVPDVAELLVEWDPLDRIQD